MTRIIKERIDASELVAMRKVSADQTTFSDTNSCNGEAASALHEAVSQKKSSSKAVPSPAEKCACTGADGASSGGKRSRDSDAGEVVEPPPAAPEFKQGVANRELGARGEDAAVWYLKRRGYEIIARNWTCVAGEADIIALCDEAIVFVEVKTRSSTDMGMPEEAVGEKKRSRYEKIAALFLADYDIVDVQVRFDIISLVVIGSNRALVRHHINAFGVA